MNLKLCFLYDAQQTPSAQETTQPKVRDFYTVSFYDTKAIGKTDTVWACPRQLIRKHD